jgi:hypothetical protein
MNRIARALFLFAPLASFAFGCSSHPGESLGGSTSAASQSASMPTLPWAGGTGALSPWGGADPNRWRPEAVMANAASEALNMAWTEAGVREAIVAVPVKMLSSNFFEFGDGQSNAAPSFEWWGSKRPPVVATLLRYAAAPTKIVFKFDRDLPYAGTRTERAASSVAFTPFAMSSAEPMPPMCMK